MDAERAGSSRSKLFISFTPSYSSTNCPTRNHHSRMCCPESGTLRSFGGAKTAPLCTKRRRRPFFPAICDGVGRGVVILIILQPQRRMQGRSWLEGIRLMEKRASARAALLREEGGRGGLIRACGRLLRRCLITEIRRATRTPQSRASMTHSEQAIRLL